MFLKTIHVKYCNKAFLEAFIAVADKKWELYKKRKVPLVRKRICWCLSFRLNEVSSRQQDSQLSEPYKRYWCSAPEKSE